MGIFGRRRNSVSEPRSWDAVQDLIARLSTLCDSTWRREFRMGADADGIITINMTVNKAEFSGTGRTPWEAAAHIAEQSASLSKSIDSILADELGEASTAEAA